MKEQIPDIQERIQQDFGNTQREHITSLLETYDSEEKHRVIRCILHLAKGDLTALRQALEAAKKDYRDVIYWAEYTSNDHQIFDFTQPFHSQHDTQSSHHTEVPTIRLQILSDYGATETFSVEAPSEAMIVRQMHALDWNSFHQVILLKAHDEYLEVGGSQHPSDGFSAIYREKGQDFVSEPPPSFQDMINLLVSYFRDDDLWRTQVTWGYPNVL